MKAQNRRTKTLACGVYYLRQIGGAIPGHTAGKYSERNPQENCNNNISLAPTSISQSRLSLAEILVSWYFLPAAISASVLEAKLRTLAGCGSRPGQNGPWRAIKQMELGLQPNSAWCFKSNNDSTSYGNNSDEVKAGSPANQHLHPMTTSGMKLSCWQLKRRGSLQANYFVVERRKNCAIAAGEQNQNKYINIYTMRGFELKSAKILHC